MARKRDGAKKLDWNLVMGGQEDFRRPLVEEIVWQVRGAEMEEALGAGKGGRSSGRPA